MSKIKVFFCFDSGDVQTYLRRYRSFNKHECPRGSYCNAQTLFHRVKSRRSERGYLLPNDDMAPPHEDPRWPVKCEACGEAFKSEDPYQLFQDAIYRDAAGNEWPLRDLPPGACYDAPWYAEMGMVGADGRSLVVILPGKRPWCIDSRANNCTNKDNKVHRCWVRHGKPEDGTLHVDKNGNTCSAGAGSIAVPGYHGFLHNGFLTDC